MSNEIIHPISRAAYDERPEINNSALRHIAQSPAHFIFHRTNPEPPTPAMQLGAYYDHLLFGTECKFAVCPFQDFRKDAAREWKAEHLSHGFTIVTQDQNAEAQIMLRRIRENQDAVDLLSSGIAQAGVFCEYPLPDGRTIGLRCLPDWLPSNLAIVLDLKTTEDASPEAFGRKVLSMDYHVQAWAYSRALEIVTGERFQFGWIVQENVAPYESAVYIAEPDVLELGRLVFEERLARYETCLETNAWPGYVGRRMLGLPPWARRKLENDNL